jgi:hypothetical protein
VAGLGNKDRDFWREIGKWEVVVMVETWVDEKGWERVKWRLSSGYEWGVKWGERESRKERVIGGMVMGVRKEIVDRARKMVTDREGVIVGNVRMEKEVSEIWGVYVN